jgi:hypothetical protein
MRLVNIVVSAGLALAVFVVGGGLMVLASSSFVWVLGAGTDTSHAVGGVAGLLFGGLVATPFALRLRRLLRRD